MIRRKERTNHTSRFSTCIASGGKRTLDGVSAFFHIHKPKTMSTGWILPIKPEILVCLRRLSFGTTEVFPQQIYMLFHCICSYLPRTSTSRIL